MSRLFLAACIALIAAGSPACANDSTAELSTGGLVLKRTPDIAMRSEDLYISAREVRVRYVFANLTDRDVTETVAFPMPDIEIEHMDQNISIPTDDPRNILGFRTRVDGKPVSARVEQKVFKGAEDRTDMLARLGVPLAPHLAATRDALDRLSPQAQQQILAAGLAEIEEYDVGKGMEKHLSPRWRLQTTYYWSQTFPARREIVVEHAYRPSVGASVMTALGAAQAPSEAWMRTYQQNYCMDEPFLRAVSRAKKPKDWSAPFSEERISYVLRTGANWAQPIGAFRVVVDKGEPGNLVSFCGESVKKIAPTQFEMRKTDWLPDRDLHILILKPLKLQ